MPIQNYNLNSYYHFDFIEFSIKTPDLMKKYIGINKDEVKELSQTHLTNNERKLYNKSNIKVSKKEKLLKKYHIKKRMKN